MNKQKNKLKFEIVFEALHQQSLIELNKIVIRNLINFKYSNFEHHENNIVLRQFWEKIKSLWKIKKSNVDWNNNNEKKYDKNDLKQYFEDANKIDKISKQKKMTFLLKKKNKVYLYIENLKINKKKNKKFDHVKVESFFIKIVKKSINYELNFFVDVKIFLVFHIFALKLTYFDTLIQTIFRYQSQEN